MKLKEWKNHFEDNVKSEAHSYVKKHGHKEVIPTPLEPLDIKLQRLRYDIEKERINGLSDLTNAVDLIINLLPSRLAPEEWQKVCYELLMVEDNALQYFEEIKDRGGNVDFNTLPYTYEVLGLSLSTFDHIKSLLFELLNEEDFHRALDISNFLVTVYENQITGWLGLARTYDLMGEHHRAIEVFGKIQKVLPKDPLSHLLCARSYVSVNDLENAKIQLKKGEELLDEEAELKETWLPVLNSIKEIIKQKE